MKPIRKLTESPTELSEFVDNFPQERNWKVFKDYNGGSAYKKLLNDLYIIQHGLCCYCEIDIQELDWQVEHFHPKRDQTSEENHTTDYRNLIAACCGGSRFDIWGSGNPREKARDSVRHRDPTRDHLSCGQAKDHYESKNLGTAVIDPRSLPASRSIIRVTIDGQLEPDVAACAEADINENDVHNTIKMLGLNCERLRVPREEKMKNLSKMYNDMDIDVLIAAARSELTPNKSGVLPRFFTVSRTFFQEAAEIVLSEQPQAWI